MKLVCVHSRVSSFKVDDIVKPYPGSFLSNGKRRNLVVGRTSLRWFLNSDDGLSIVSRDVEPYATFKPFQKSLRKMMVRAFVKYAKKRGWGWVRGHYNNANDWARSWVDDYFLNDGTPIGALAYYFEPGQQITQHDIDGFVDEEMSYL